MSTALPLIYFDQPWTGAPLPADLAGRWLLLGYAEVGAIVYVLAILFALVVVLQIFGLMPANHDGRGAAPARGRGGDGPAALRRALRAPVCLGYEDDESPQAW